MKYFTRQWYHDMQKGHLHFGLEVSDEANDYNKEYFQRLYKERMSERMIGYLEWADEDQLKLKSAEDFAADWYLRSLNELSNRLPDEIKDGIADIRVAALGFVTQDMLDKIKAFCENMRTQTHAQATMYWEYYKSIQDSIPKRIRQPLGSQHDADIKRIGVLNEDYIIETNQYNGKYKFTFKNASVRQDIVKSGSLTWIYDEIYLQDSKYEVHILFYDLESLTENRDIMLTDAIICAEDIEVETIINTPDYHTEFL